MAKRKENRKSRCATSPYWKTGPDEGDVVDGMRPHEEINSWVPAVAHLGVRKLAQTSARKTVLKVLEICSGCCSVSTAAGKEARENFGVDEVDVFSIDCKPNTNASRIVDVLTYDWENDELLNTFRREQEEGTQYVYYAHASPPCGMYSSMSCPTNVAARSRVGRLGGAAVHGAHELLSA